MVITAGEYFSFWALVVVLLERATHWRAENTVWLVLFWISTFYLSVTALFLPAYVLYLFFVFLELIYANRLTITLGFLSLPATWLAFTCLVAAWRQRHLLLGPIWQVCVNARNGITAGYRDLRASLWHAFVIWPPQVARDVFATFNAAVAALEMNWEELDHHGNALHVEQPNEEEEKAEKKKVQDVPQEIMDTPPTIEQHETGLPTKPSIQEVDARPEEKPSKVKPGPNPLRKLALDHGRRVFEKEAKLAAQNEIKAEPEVDDPVLSTSAPVEAVKHQTDAALAMPVMGDQIDISAPKLTNAKLMELLQQQEASQIAEASTPQPPTPEALQTAETTCSRPAEQETPHTAEVSVPSLPEGEAPQTAEPSTPSPPEEQALQTAEMISLRPAEQQAPHTVEASAPSPPKRGKKVSFWLPEDSKVDLEAQEKEREEHLAQGSAQAAPREVTPEDGRIPCEPTTSSVDIPVLPGSDQPVQSSEPPAAQENEAEISQASNSAITPAPQALTAPMPATPAGTSHQHERQPTRNVGRLEEEVPMELDEDMTDLGNTSADPGAQDQEMIDVARPVVRQISAALPQGSSSQRAVDINAMDVDPDYAPQGYAPESEMQDVAIPPAATGPKAGTQAKPHTQTPQPPIKSTPHAFGPPASSRSQFVASSTPASAPAPVNCDGFLTIPNGTRIVVGCQICGKPSTRSLLLKICMECTNYAPKEQRKQGVAIASLAVEKAGEPTSQVAGAVNKSVVEKAGEAAGEAAGALNEPVVEVPEALDDTQGAGTRPFVSSKDESGIDGHGATLSHFFVDKHTGQKPNPRGLGYVEHIEPNPLQMLPSAVNHPLQYLRDQPPEAEKLLYSWLTKSFHQLKALLTKPTAQSVFLGPQYVMWKLPVIVCRLEQIIEYGIRRGHWVGNRISDGRFCSLRLAARDYAATCKDLRFRIKTWNKVSEYCKIEFDSANDPIAKIERLATHIYRAGQPMYMADMAPEQFVPPQPRSQPDPPASQATGSANEGKSSNADRQAAAQTTEVKPAAQVTVPGQQQLPTFESIQPSTLSLPGRPSGLSLPRNAIKPSTPSVTPQQALPTVAPFKPSGLSLPRNAVNPSTPSVTKQQPLQSFAPLKSSPLSLPRNAINQSTSSLALPQSSSSSTGPKTQATPSTPMRQVTASDTQAAVEELTLALSSTSIRKTNFSPVVMAIPRETQEDEMDEDREDEWKDLFWEDG